MFGTIGGILLTISAIPQIYKIIKTKKADDLSIIFVVLLLLGKACWLLHGVTKKDTQLVVWNFVGVVLAAVLVGLILIARKKK
jgi:MtN3 and saliva related transmembrane protein